MPMLHARLFSLACASAFALAVAAASAFAGSTLSLPESDTGAIPDRAFTITNTATGSSTVTPRAVVGIVTGADAVGVVGSSQGAGGVGVFGDAEQTGSIAVHGLNSGTGFAGFFGLTGAGTTGADSALEAINSGGSNSPEGMYGNAGIFAITNAMNESPAVSIATNGINAYALKVVNSGTEDRTITNPPSNNGGGIAGYFEINNANTITNQAAIFAVSSGGSTTTAGAYGVAGYFQITNPENEDPAVAIFSNGLGGSLDVVNSGGSASGSAAVVENTNANNDSPALLVQTESPSATAIRAYIGYDGNGIGLEGEADGASGIGVYGFSYSGTGVYGSSDTSGTGVSGSSYSGTGVSGSSVASGTGVYGTSYNGHAAEFVGTDGTVTCYFPSGTTWSCTSDRNAKEDFHEVDLKDMLHRLAAMPVFTYKVKHQSDTDARWLGPVAQDFKAAFGLGETNDDKHINLGNEMGVALAAIKGLYAELQDRDARIAALESEMADMKASLTRLSQATVHEARTEHAAE
jgi:hypothetical protein